MASFMGEPSVAAPFLADPPFDIAKFLRELPAIMPRDVPDTPEDGCSICLIKHNQENPDSFFTEHPCRLPCGHVFGRGCIAKWLKPHPEGSNASSCPHCRRQLFPAWEAIPREPAVLGVPARMHRNHARISSNVRERLEQRERGRNVHNQMGDFGLVARAEITAVQQIQQDVNTPQTRPPRGLDANALRARIQEIRRQTQARGRIEQARSRDARLRDVMLEVQERNGGQGPNALQARLIDMAGQIPDQRTSVLGARLPGNENQHASAGLADTVGARPSDYHIRVAEDAGFHVSSQRTETLRNAREREEMTGRRAANRRRVALRERDLYRMLTARGARLPRPEDPTDELLDHRQDQALFEWLQSHNAFQGLGLNETFRIVHDASQAGATGLPRPNREIYEMLRDCGAFFQMDNDGNGMWRTREHHLFDDEDEDLSSTFQELLREGALLDSGLRGLFPGTNPFQMFRRALELRLTWDTARRHWTFAGVDGDVQLA